MAQCVRRYICRQSAQLDDASALGWCWCVAVNAASTAKVKIKTTFSGGDVKTNSIVNLLLAQPPDGGSLRVSFVAQNTYRIQYPNKSRGYVFPILQLTSFGCSKLVCLDCCLHMQLVATGAPSDLCET